MNKRNLTSLLSVLPLCLTALSCWSEGLHPKSTDSLDASALFADDEQAETLCNTIAAPARPVPFQTKDGRVKVWVGSVRTQSDSQARPLTATEKAFLDVIAAAEGTSIIGRPSCGVHAGYEAIQACYWTNSRFSYLSLDEILFGHPQRSVGGTRAAGRYQFLPKTWQEIGRLSRQRTYPLDSFSPSAQDRAAIMTIKRRRSERVAALGGVSPHKALLQLDDRIRERGAPSAKEEAIFEAILGSLAKEWASFPVLGSGRSHYPGQSAQSAAELGLVFKEAYAIYAVESAGPSIASAN